jgi:hypothetical protein
MIDGESEMTIKSSFRPFWPAIALAAVFLLISAGTGTGRAVPAAEPRDLVVFTSAGAERIEGLEVKGALRQRTVEINPALGQSNGVGLGDRLWMTPFADRSYLAVVDRVEMDVNGVLAVRGRVEGWDYSYVLLSSRGGQTLGSLSIPEQGLDFDIRPVMDTGEHLVLEVDSRNRDFLEDAPPLESPAEESDDLLGFQSPAASSAQSLSAEARLDVMVVYTPAARDWAASRGGIDFIISQDMQHDILAMQNSGLDIAARLVHSELVNYTESGDSGADLGRLQDTDDGNMDDIHKWRNTHSADLVQLLALVNDTGGIGYLLNRTSGSPAYAFTLVRIQQAGWSYTSIHEIGHNLGCHHRKDQAVQPGPGLFSYSAGWRWIGSDGNRYCSIMSYQDDWDGNKVTQVPYFSSPLFTYMGVAVGNALNADNARTISQTGPVVGSYRKKQNARR